MAAPDSPPRRPTRTPARPRALSSTAPDSGPPPKRRRYIPGGPGGGGRYIDDEGHETPAPRSVRRQPSDVNADDNDDATTHPTSPRSSRRAPSSTTRSRRDGDTDRPRRRPAPTPRPRYSSAAAAAAASQASDGYKPREERSWEEFHPDLDITQSLMVFTADEVDGRNAKNPLLDGLCNPDITPPAPVLIETPIKRKPGRPPKRPESMLSGLGSPPAPRILPLPTHNPKERLNLLKASYRTVDTFAQYEQDRAVQVNYVDKAMAHVGYQEGDRFDLPQATLIRHVDGVYDDDTITGLNLASDNVDESASRQSVVFNVEYDMDEQDERWLEAHNARRKEEQAEPIKPAVFEITMTQIEREYYALEKRIPKPNPRHAQITRPRSSSAAAVNGEPNGPGDEPDTKCAICDDGDCENANAIIFCDGCDLAVHQECYGVPFIPEGQWFCRKCKEIGRGTPTCIFCPNIDGAFKQTSTLRWSHLLCAIWIPEVSIANTTFMEPIQDVDKVPKSRWSLLCSICNQRMGACIQCSNKHCCTSFHVTCARRARLFMKMKSTQAGGIDASVLKAFCDRHVPSDWRHEHDVDNALAEARRYYRHTMRNRKWADSSSTSLALSAPQPDAAAGNPDELGHGDDTIVVAGNKRKRSQPQKTGWRLPSGAPVVPAVVFNTVDTSLQRFALRKRKEFVTEACKYWTLKREARKGAALLKRLQLQLESFSPMEITRRNFTGMGAAGRPRLVRRIDFGDMLSKDVNRLENLITSVRRREEMKLTDTEILRDLIDNIYFPITPLLWPILKRAQKLDEKTEIFKEGFDALEKKLAQRYYNSVAAFSADFGAVFSAVLAQSDQNVAELRDVTDIHNQLNEIPAGTAQHLALTQEQKEVKRLTKRIVKAMKEPLANAMKKEAELKDIPFEREMNEWAAFDARLEHSIQSNNVLTGTPMLPSMENGDSIATDTSVSAVAGASPSRTDGDNHVAEDVEMPDADVALEHVTAEPDAASINALSDASAMGTMLISPPNSNSGNLQIPEGANGNISHNIAPPAATREDPWARGGVPWYLDPFDISGTTIHEERWTGPETMRAMSDLSDMDEETLLEVFEQSNPAAEGEAKTRSAATRSSTRIKQAEANGNTATEEEGEEEEEEEEEEETEEQRLAREKREKANARRRAQRRRRR